METQKVDLNNLSGEETQRQLYATFEKLKGREPSYSEKCKLTHELRLAQKRLYAALYDKAPGKTHERKAEYTRELLIGNNPIRAAIAAKEMAAREKLAALRNKKKLAIPTLEDFVSEDE